MAVADINGGYIRLVKPSPPAPAKHQPEDSKQTSDYYVARAAAAAGRGQAATAAISNGAPVTAAGTAANTVTAAAGTAISNGAPVTAAGTAANTVPGSNRSLEVPLGTVKHPVYEIQTVCTLLMGVGRYVVADQQHQGVLYSTDHTLNVIQMLDCNTGE